MTSGEIVPSDSVILRPMSRKVTPGSRAISLSRDVPTGLGWIINPIIRSLPRESLSNTLRETRQALTRVKP